ncbi:MAG: hypothetical protein A3E87_10300 [Gammaproteobacteria bacterium RIFCSPHIGHO2_12_FULL_35_23]|nr:MAG: hypothetical protein A3E87_10300 [Gammaproteobacteria bacterium RIFCSPHIGHO2_12_FULL_35_23]
MTTQFKNVGLIGKLQDPHTAETCKNLINYLKTQSISIYIDNETAKLLETATLRVVNKEKLGEITDLIIVVGGDGSLLHTARLAVNYKTPIVGINRGRLGFLTDIKPSEIETKIAAILAGHYNPEQRFLLAAHLNHKSSCSALNDIVIASKDSAHMMEYEVYIDDCFMCSERADGIIIATPTGSTAYALSGGGPIVHPALNAIVVVPMFSHTLTSRPIVLPGDSKITIIIGEKTDVPAKLSIDGQVHCSLQPNDQVIIQKKPQTLTLLHPLDYDYFANVRSKLQWGKKLTSGESE